MRDGYGRTLSYLRVSVTDRCNLRCRYCMPADGLPSVSHDEILRFDEITRLVRIMAGMGVSRVRLTGGEPLVRKNIAALAAEIKGISGVDYLGLTTNGVLLSTYAAELLRAGVDGLNISLDSADPRRYEELTRRDELARAMAGLDAALSLPFSSVKINCVLAPQSGPTDWLGVAELARHSPVDVRFIEWMPISGEATAAVTGADALLTLLADSFGALRPLGTAAGCGPAEYWQAAGFAGRIGVIRAMSHSFCGDCNRLRISSTGDLRLCLFYDEGISLRDLLRDGASDVEIRAAISTAVLDKPQMHHGERELCENDGKRLLNKRCGGMHEIGG